MASAPSGSGPASSADHWPATCSRTGAPSIALTVQFDIAWDTALPLVTISTGAERTVMGHAEPDRIDVTVASTEPPDTTQRFPRPHTPVPR